jgi:hypothetical protein
MRPATAGAFGLSFLSGLSEPVGAAVASCPPAVPARHAGRCSRWSPG